MRSSTLLAVVLLFLGACSGPQEPVFKKVENIRSEMISTGRISISGDALYFNPNTISGTVTATDITVFANDIDAATIEQSLEIEAPAQSEFRIPFTFTTTPRAILQQDAGGALGGILNAVLNKKVDLRYEGFVTIKVAGIPFNVEVDYEEEVEIK